jgi:hypothetical protein
MGSILEVGETKSDWPSLHNEGDVIHADHCIRYPLDCSMSLVASTPAQSC